MGGDLTRKRRLARPVVGLPLINEFRRADLESGGDGAPIAPLYHEALVNSLGAKGPVAVLNIGGFANVSYVDTSNDTLIAFDTSPGNGPIDEWLEQHTGAPAPITGGTYHPAPEQS